LQARAFRLTRLQLPAPLTASNWLIFTVPSGRGGDFQLSGGGSKEILYARGLGTRTGAEARSIFLALTRRWKRRSSTVVERAEPSQRRRTGVSDPHLHGGSRQKADSSWLAALARRNDKSLEFATLRHQLTLVAANVSEFSRVKGLVWRDWAKA
jgi:hypothetical protein